MTASMVINPCLTLPQAMPFPRLSFTGSINLPKAPPKTICLSQTPFSPRGFSAKVGRLRVSEPVARRSLGISAAKNNELRILSHFIKHGGRSSYEYWRQQAIQSERDKQDQISHADLYTTMKVLVSILSFVSVDGDPSNGLKKERCELILQSVADSNYGVDVLPEEHAPCLARVVKNYTDIRATQQRFRELEFQEFSIRRKLMPISLIGAFWCLLRWVAAFVAGGLFYFLLFSCVVTRRCATNQASSLPEGLFGIGLLLTFVNFLEKLKNLPLLGWSQDYFVRILYLLMT